MTSKQKEQLMKESNGMKPSSTPSFPVVRQKDAFSLSETFSQLKPHVPVSIAEDIRRDGEMLVRC